MLEREGGYVAHPADPGGATKYGISDRRDGAIDGLADLDDDGKGDKAIRDLTVDDVRDIYYRVYWQGSGASQLSWPLSLVHFDAAVNHGVRAAKMMLRKSGGDPARYLQLRRARYAEAVAREPARRVFLRGWLARLDHVGREVAAASHSRSQDA